MSNYVLPAATFQQEFQLLAAAVQQTLFTCVVGPRRKVVKDGLSSSDETDYGAYDPDADTEYDFLGLPAGEEVDPASVDVVLKDVYGRYATLSGGNVIEATAAANQIKVGAGHEAANRLAETATQSRFTALGERDVRVGDHLKITHEGGTLWTQVAALIQEQSAAVCANKTGADIAAADANDSVNPATQIAALVYAKIDDAGSGRPLMEYGLQDVAYNGDLAAGDIGDTYTLECIVGGGTGVAKVKITSLKGDNVAETTVLAASFNVGTKGLASTFDFSTGDLEVGEKWSITAKAAYTQKELTIVGGTDANYTGLVDTTYQIKVVKGGTWAQSPKVSVTTNNNVDSSGAVVVSADEIDIALGTLGVTVEFKDNTDPQGGLRLGDIYLVEMTAAADDGARTIQLRKPLPTEGSINASGYDLTVEFLVKQDSHTIPATDYPDPADLNWELPAGGTAIDLKSGIEITDSSVLDGSSDLVSLPVVKAQVSVYYTAILTLEGGKIGVIDSQSLVDDILGDVVPENELAYGVDIALRNSGGVPVYYLTVAGDDLAAYTDALGEAEKNDDLYFMVPMSHDVAVQDLLKSHVIDMSSETNGLERIAIVNRTVADEKDLFVTRDNDTAWTGYIALGPETSPAQYRQVTMPGAEFITDGVQPGDVLKTNFSIDVNGQEVFETYVVEEVTDEENLLIASGPAAPVGGVGNEHRIEVVHPYTSLERAELAAAQAEFFGDRRVTNIFPDSAIDVSGETVPGYFLAAAYAGIKSGVVAHQPITNTDVQGFLSIPQTLNGFNRSELNVIAGGGNAIITQELESGQVFIRHSITTDQTDVNTAELNITTNLDAITKFLRVYIKPLIGQYNVTPEFLIMLETLSAQRLDFLIQETQTVKAGPQIVEVGTIRAVQDPDVRTKVLMEIPLTLPYAANNIVTKLIVV